jgi:hypothetical protein
MIEPIDLSSQTRPRTVTAQSIQARPAFVQELGERLMMHRQAWQ